MRIAVELVALSAALAAAAPAPAQASPPPIGPAPAPAPAAAPASGAISLPLRAPRAASLHVRAPSDVISHIQSEREHALAKYGFAVHEHRKRGVSLSSWGAGYTIPVSVGTPPQTFNIIPDTGSYDFWVIGSCSNAAECGRSKKFDPAASSSFADTGLFFGTNYVDGITQSGTYGVDRVTVGGQVLERADVAVVNETGKFGWPMDGIMGFGPGLSNPNTLPWWLQAMDEWTVQQFGMYLGRIPPEQIRAANETGMAGYGDLTLGGVNTSLFTGDITFYPTAAGSESTRWEIGMRPVVVGAPVAPYYSAIIDSGTTLIIGPDTFVRSFYEALPTSKISLGNGQYLFRAGPLNASFAFDGGSVDRVFDLDDNDLCYYRAPASFWEVGLGRIFGSTPATADTTQWCMGAVMSDANLPPLANGTAQGLQAWLVGNVFMKNVYSVFRFNPMAVGFAQLTPEANKKYEAPTVEEMMSPRPTAAPVAGSGGPRTEPGAGPGPATVTVARSSAGVCRAAPPIVLMLPLVAVAVWLW